MGLLVAAPEPLHGHVGVDLGGGEAAVAQDLLDRAQAVLPVVRGARIEGVRLGWRPMPADGLSAVGPVSGLAGYYLAFTHSGVTLGPVLGRMVCDEILTGQPRPELAPFRPDRLISRV
jgi:glycine/D-amino acid oxidase-like deaminating enzyme